MKEGGQMVDNVSGEEVVVEKGGGFDSGEGESKEQRGENGYDRDLRNHRGGYSRLIKAS